MAARVLVTGSRNWTDRTAVYGALDAVLHEYVSIVVVHGACPAGADAMAVDWIAEAGDADVTEERHPANWGRHGRAAGPIRNNEMVKLGADLCLAFIRRDSRGASQCAQGGRDGGDTRCDPPGGAVTDVDKRRFQVITGGVTATSRATGRTAGSNTLTRHIVASYDDAVAHARWAAGMVVPHNITTALDLLDLFGPEVDRACNANEPEVDRWEAGKLYPRWDQLLALAALTERPAAWFTELGHPIGLLDTSMRFHLSHHERARLTARDVRVITRYPDDVVARREGTDLWKRDRHL